MLKEKEKFMGQAVLHYQKNGKSSVSSVII